jgi:D-aminoacyl-tRNA deacylase
MRAVVQRVTRGSVTVDGEVVGQIGRGFVVLVGVADGDTPEDAAWLAAKVAGLRVFEDAEGKMNLALGEVGGEVLVISQFTLLGDCRKGRRPGFDAAARPEVAVPLYEAVVTALRATGLRVETGRFQTHMAVELVNDGPVTLLLDSQRVF